MKAFLGVVLIHRGNLVQFLFSETEWLFNKDMLACLKSPDHQGRVAIVTGPDQYDINRGILKNGLGVRRTIGRTNLRSQCFGIDSGSRTDPSDRDLLQGSEWREKHVLHMVAGSDQAERDRPDWFGWNELNHS